MKCLVLLCSLPLLVSCSSDEGSPSPATPPRASVPRELDERSARLERAISGCKVVGRATATGSTEPVEATLTVVRATKVKADQWRFDVRVGEAAPLIPLAGAVAWEGDTAVIEVKDAKIPAGTFGVRVEVSQGQCVGTWSGADATGGLSGQIVRDSWSSWRGPDGNGLAPGANPPTEWNEDRNVRWKVPIPGRASSSPVVWNDRIYLTTAIETDVEGAAPSGRRPTKVHEFVVLALDRADGSVVWRRVVAEKVPHEPGHKTATQASNSPLVDGSRIYAHFGSRGLHCLDMQGEVQWSKDFGPMRTRAKFGEGSSPALHGDTLVVNWDHEGDSFVVAFDRRTGDELWRRPRDERTSWSTPLVATVDGRSQVVIAATGASRGYDLATGDEVWSCSGMTEFLVASPVHADGIAYLISGYEGAALQAVRLSGAKGDITETESVAWTHTRSTSYVPSPLVYDGYVYFQRVNTGVLSCLDARTGAVHYESKRLRGIRSVYSSSVGAAGRVYITGRGGVTKVIKLGPVFEELASNELEDEFDASPALVGGELFLRGKKHLYCIAEQ